jgi:hypothetical protein
MDTRVFAIPSLPLELAFLATLQVVESEPREMKPRKRNPSPEVPAVDDPPTKEIENKAGMQTSMSNEDVSFVAVRSQWKEILQAARRFDPRTQALLNSGRPLGLEGGVLTLGFRSDLLREKMEKDHNIVHAQRAAEQVLGQPIVIHCILLSAWRSVESVDQPTPPMEEGGMVATAVRDFGAQVVDVEKSPPEG